MSDPNDIQSATQVSDDKGRQYHINLGPGDVAPFVIIVGDQNRAEKASKYLQNIRLQRKSREFWSFTGEYKDIPVTILSTGIGTDNVEIAIVELLQTVSKPTIIRVGSCGALQPEIGLGDLVISTGAVRLENTSLYFVEEGYPAIAHYETILALSQACVQNKVIYHQGLSASGSGFYGAQGRNLPGFPLRYPDLQEKLSERNVFNFEMESSTLFTLGTLQGLRTGTICAVYANRFSNNFISMEQKQETEKNCIIAGLEACRILSKMDKVKKEANSKNWLPSLSFD